MQRNNAYPLYISNFSPYICFRGFNCYKSNCWLIMVCSKTYQKFCFTYMKKDWMTAGQSLKKSTFCLHLTLRRSMISPWDTLFCLTYLAFCLEMWSTFLRHNSLCSIHFYLTCTDIQELCGKTKTMSERKRETCLNARK